MQSWKRTWIFDLDNTLHNARPHIFPHINQAMTAYVERQLGLEPDAASALRQQYLEALRRDAARSHAPSRYRPAPFPVADASVPGIEAHARARARAARARYAGCRGASSFSRTRRCTTRARFSRRSRVADLFDGVFCIERTRFRPKPQTHGFLRLTRANGLRARRCIMVEDTLENLRTAKKLGMKTVWVSREPRAPRYVDLKIANLSELRRALPRLA